MAHVYLTRLPRKVIGSMLISCCQSPCFPERGRKLANGGAGIVPYVMIDWCLQSPRGDGNR